MHVLTLDEHLSQLTDAVAYECGNPEVSIHIGVSRDLEGGIVVSDYNYYVAVHLGNMKYETVAHGPTPGALLAACRQWRQSQEVAHAA